MGWSMPAVSRKLSPKDKSGTKPRTWLTLVGGITAVISLLLGLNQVTGLVQTFRIHHSEFSEAIKVGQQQLQRGDYPAAFESFKRACEIDPVDRDAQDLQARAAMLWLENVRAGEKGFSEAVNPLLPVLEKDLAHAKGSKAADLLAHIGWGNFLRSRDVGTGGGNGELPIQQSYEQAVRADANNVYAHAMWGHWILWTNGELAPARAHFSAALQSGRERPYVRHLEIAALCNSSKNEAPGELFRVANEMRENREEIEPGDRRRMFDEAIVDRVYHHDELTRVLKGINPEQALATYDWLSQAYVTNNEFDRERREFIVAFLADLAGKRSEAVSEYRSLRQEVRKSQNLYMIGTVDEELKRLTTAQAKDQ